MTITKSEFSEKEKNLLLEKKKMANNSNNAYQFPKKKNIHIKRKVQRPYAQKMLYSFDSFDAFCDFCTFINKTKYKAELSEFAKFASLYKYNSNYYLNLTGINLDTNLLDFLCPTITEFAHFVDNPELFERQITEYGTPIIKENAFVVGATYFAKKSKVVKNQKAI